MAEDPGEWLKYTGNTSEISRGGPDAKKQDGDDVRDGAASSFSLRVEPASSDARRRCYHPDIPVD